MKKEAKEHRKEASEKKRNNTSTCPPAKKNKMVRAKKSKLDVMFCTFPKTRPHHTQFTTKVLNTVIQDSL
jgi:hypothetical protein